MNHNGQFQSKEKLAQQKQELQRYLATAGSKESLTSHQSSAAQKLNQIKEALKHNGEIDPAFRINKKYSHGAIYKNNKD